MIRLDEEVKSGKLQLLLDHNSIQSRVRGLAKEINDFYQWEKSELIVIALADGANIFVSDLVRLLPLKLKLYFLKIKTYEGTNKIAKSVLNIEELTDIENKNVLILDDILDTGETLSSVIKSVEMLKPNTIKTVILLCKNRNRDCGIKINFVGFNIIDKWVFGYGMDMDGFYRNLNDIYILKQ